MADERAGIRIFHPTGGRWDQLGLVGPDGRARFASEREVLAQEFLVQLLTPTNPDWPDRGSDFLEVVQGGVATQLPALQAAFRLAAADILARMRAKRPTDVLQLESVELLGGTYLTDRLVLSLLFRFSDGEEAVLEVGGQ